MTRILRRWRWAVHDTPLGRARASCPAAARDASSRMASACVYGDIAALGVATQGIFTLAPPIGARCCLHWIGALAFFWGASQHQAAMTSLYGAAQAGASPGSALLLPAIHFIVAFRAVLRSGADAAPFGIAIVLLGGQLAGITSSGVGAAVQNGLGGMQWVIVAAYTMCVSDVLRCTRRIFRVVWCVPAAACVTTLHATFGL